MVASSPNATISNSSTRPNSCHYTAPKFVLTAVSPPSHLPEVFDGIVGRNHELNALDRIFDPAASSACLVGDAGMGKTHVAKFFGHAWGSMMPNRFVYWLPCNTEHRMRRGYLGLLDALGVTIRDGGPERLSTATLAKVAWRNLREAPFDWMVIYDGVPDVTEAGFLSTLMPLPEDSRGRILFTQTSGSVASHAENEGKIHRIDVGALDPDAAIELLQSNGNLVTSDKGYLAELPKSMVELLGCKPLSIDTVGAFLDDARITVQDLMVRHVQNFEDFADTALKLSLAHALSRQELTPILDVVAYTDPEHIPLFDLLGTGMTGALSDLCRLKLLQPAPGKGLFRVHPQHQRILQEVRDPVLALGIMELQAGFFDGEKSETWDIAHSLLPHVRAILGHVSGPHYFGRARKLLAKYAEMLSAVFDNFREAELVYITIIEGHKQITQTDESKIDLANTHQALGRLYERKDLFDRAQGRYEDALKLKRSLYGNDPSPSNYGEMEELLLRLGMLYKRQKMYDAALTKYVRVLRIKRHRYGPHSVNVDLADVLYILGFLCHKCGDCETALKRFEEALRMYHYIYGEGGCNPDIAMTVYNIGTVLQTLGHNDKSLQFFHQALSMKMKIYGSDGNNFDIAKTLRSIGYSYHFCGHYDPAMAKLEEALKMYKNVYGLDAVNSELADLLNNLGNVYCSRGDVEDAKQKYEEALQMYKHGYDSYGNSDMKVNMAAVLRNLGSLAIAKAEDTDAVGTPPLVDEEDRVVSLEYLDEALAIYPGIDDPGCADIEVAKFLISLGNTYKELNEFEKAKKSMESAIEVLGSIEDKGGVAVLLAGTLYTVGNIYKKLGEHGSSKLLLEEAVNTYGPGTKSIDCARALNDLCEVLIVLGDFSGATEKVTESLAMLNEVYNSDTMNMDFYTTLCNLGLVYKNLGEFENAQAAYDEAEVIYRHLHRSVNNFVFAKFLCLQGEMQLKLDHQNNAREKMIEATEILEQLYGRDAKNADLVRAYTLLAQVEAAAKSYDTAKSIYKRALTMQIGIYGEDAVNKDIARTMFLLGKLFKQMDDFDAAQSMFKGALDMYKEVYDKTDFRNEDILETTAELDDLRRMYKIPTKCCASTLPLTALQND